MLRIARNRVDGRLNRNTLYSSTEVTPVQCARGMSASPFVCQPVCMSDVYYLKSFCQLISCALCYFKLNLLRRVSTRLFL